LQSTYHYEDYSNILELMMVHSFTDLLPHIGHKIVVVGYSKDFMYNNVAIECEDCFQVLLDFDKE